MAVAEVMVGRDRDLLRRGNAGLGGVLPIHVDLVEVDAVVVEDLEKLRAAGRHQDIGRASGWKTFAEEVGIEEEDAAIDLKVEVLEVLGADQYLYGKIGSDDLIARVDPALKVSIGDRVRLAVNMKRLHLFDTETEKAVF